MKPNQTNQPNKKATNPSPQRNKQASKNKPKTPQHIVLGTTDLQLGGWENVSKLSLDAQQLLKLNLLLLAIGKGKILGWTDLCLSG